MKSNSRNQKPFRVEELRQTFAQKGNFSKILKTYSDKFPEIKDLNIKSFWNKRIVIDRPSLKNNHIYQDKINIISRYLCDKKGKLLDVGFGWGSIEKKIEDNQKIDIFGIDISDEAVKFANKNLRGDFSVGSVFAIPFRNSEFDVVLALDVFEHIRPSLVFNAYKEINRVLKKNGIYIISIPINEGLEKMIKKGLNPVGHLRAYTPDVIKTELKISGFKVLNTKYRYAFKTFYRLKSFIVKLDFLKIKKPNLMIIFSKKIC